MYPEAERHLLTEVVRSPQFSSVIKLPLIPWQHLGLVALVYATLFGLGALYLLDYLPYWLMLPPAVFVMYVAFTPLHDATHRSVSRNPLINDLVGGLSVQVLIPGATVAVYRFLHLEHHRHTGDPDLDPDEPLVSTPWPWRFFKLMFVEVFWALWYIKHRDLLPFKVWLRDATTLVIFLVWHALWLLSPYALEFVLLWMVPQRLGILTIAYLFASIQHPEGVLQSEHPLQATRMMKGYKFTRVMMLGQSQHLMHHMFPMIPYYRYHRMWKVAKPVLANTRLTWSSIIGKQNVPHDLRHQPELLLVVTVSAVELVADGVKAYTLIAADGDTLVEYDAGAHIDVHITDDTVRQYSLVPSEAGSYKIAVKHEVDGRGGSEAIHQQWQVGSSFLISAPRNVFALDAGTQHAVLVAGGIGITPLLAMADTLELANTSFDFHACAANKNNLPFADALQQASYRDRISYHLSQTSDGQRFSATDMSSWSEGHHLYLCGSNAFMDAVLAHAEDRGWPASAIHTERFNAVPIGANNEAFTITLAKSGKDLTVPADRSMLEVLQENHVPIQASCMQGICATCKCKVLEGEVEHHDVVLTDADKAHGVMTACVSRAATGQHLVLDC